MNLAQKMLLLFTGIFLLLGSILILIFPGFNLVPLIVFDIIILVATRILYLGLNNKSEPTFVKKMNQGISTLKQHNTIKLPRKQQNRVLYTLNCKKPLDLFPDKLVIEERSITVISRVFFSTSISETILIKDIFSVMMNAGPFFASLSITPKTSIESAGKEIQLKYLRKDEALIAKEIIDGLLLEQSGAIKVPTELPATERGKIILEAGRHRQLENEI